jgi:hypothetical protein
MKKKAKTFFSYIDQHPNTARIPLGLFSTPLFRRCPRKKFDKEIFFYTEEIFSTF